MFVKSKLALTTGMSSISSIHLTGLLSSIHSFTVIFTFTNPERPLYQIKRDLMSAGNARELPGGKSETDITNGTITQDEEYSMIDWLQFNVP